MMPLPKNATENPTKKQSILQKIIEKDNIPNESLQGKAIS